MLSVSVNAEVVISNGVLQAYGTEQHPPGKCQVIYMSQGSLGTVWEESVYWLGTYFDLIRLEVTTADAPLFLRIVVVHYSVCSDKQRGKISKEKCSQCIS